MAFKVQDLDRPREAPLLIVIIKEAEIVKNFTNFLAPVNQGG